ncbi:hypothetical protein [Alistipes megaguti]|uniref:hypothetical protein n=1 Tax=Alistipes megaguti TaxID=2364787 RepID=UPI002355F5CA|nr:hypothetical protein [Alistipes megaguti]
MKEKILNWVGTDGLLHIICSVIIVSVLNVLLPLWAAVLITAIVGIGKEFIWDKWLKRGTFEKKDLLCDLIGIVIGCL